MVSDYNIWIAILGLASIWSIFFFYSFGFYSYRSYKAVESPKAPDNEDDTFLFSGIYEWKAWQYILSGILCWLCSILAARFYTSRGFTQVISGLFRGDQAAYSIYQHYVIDANIGTFSLTKIPYILMLVYCTVMLLWTMVGLIMSGEKLVLFKIVHLLNVILAYYYFGVARGTNFEMYIVFVILVYSLLNRPGNTLKDERRRKRSIIIIAALAVVVVIIFRAVVAARGNVFRNQICTEIKYDPNKWISQTFPTITNMGLSVFRYFGFGIFTIGMIVDKVFLQDATGVIAHLIPCGFTLIKGEDLPSITREVVDIGVGWVPDYISFINSTGLIFTFAIFFLLGCLSARLYKSKRAALLKNLIGAVIFLEMLSIPVGNFIATSTPNEISILLILIWYFKGKRHISIGRRRII